MRWQAGLEKQAEQGSTDCAREHNPSRGEGKHGITLFALLQLIGLGIRPQWRPGNEQSGLNVELRDGRVCEPRVD
jgi:hypothetical protein